MVINKLVTEVVINKFAMLLYVGDLAIEIPYQ